MLRHFDGSGQLGLLNLGQTCFLNVILQSFLANPLLRSYFLSDMHNHKTCKLKECMCCELDVLFVEVSSELNASQRSIMRSLLIQAVFRPDYTLWTDEPARNHLESIVRTRWLRSTGCT